MIWSQYQYLDNPDEHQDKEISGTNSDSDEQQIISKTEANNISWCRRMKICQI
jgi:hypothetical protein